jgi:glycogen debranching enzyme
MPDLRYFALALDPDGNPVKTIGSNAGLCLASGIVDDDKARAVVDRLMAPDMLSGWGLRTLSSDHPAFNPLAYRLGSVWPAANAHACVGCKRYGFDEALHRLARAVIDATSLFDFDRLPEVFGGRPRDLRHLHPGVYPDACSPQAWSASAVIQIFHMLTGVFVLAPLRTLVIDPALTEWMPQATIRHLRVGEESVSLRLRREADGRTRHEILSGGTGLRVLQLEPGIGVDRFALALAAALGH